MGPQNNDTRSLESEEWKPVPGYGGFYHVSNLGRIKADEREVKSRWGETIRMVKKAKIMKPSYTENGYAHIHLQGGGESRSFLVHRVVALAFVENPESKPQINHKNGIKADNTAANLEWCSSKENCLHRSKTLKKGIGEEAGLAKLTEEKVRWARMQRASGSTYVSLAKELGVTDKNIRCAILGITWGHVA